MKAHPRTWTVVSGAMAALLLGVLAPAPGADAEQEIPFSEARIFFELNDTDGDLGIHASIDGEPWKTLAIENPNELQNLRVTASGQLRQQGLTQLFFESAEPSFDELAPEVFFARFPEGDYEVEGITLDGEELESIVTVTHLIPAPVGDLSVNGEELPESCDETPLPTLGEPFTVSWEAVTESHPEIGRTGEPIEVVHYELIVERAEPTPLKFSAELPPDVTELEIPDGLANSGEVFKVEVIVREASGNNQTAVESCFEVE